MCVESSVCSINMFEMLNKKKPEKVMMALAGEVQEFSTSDLTFAPMEKHQTTFWKT